MNATTDALDVDQQTLSAPTNSRLASTLRWLGGVAVFAAGGVFMLQGFDNIGAEMRNWTLIGLMLICAGSAALIQRLFADASGARLLFGLAILLVPVQFSQLAGLIHEWVVPAGTVAPAGWAYGLQWLPRVTSPAAFWLLLGATAGLGIVVLKTGFSVLARELARPLTLYMLVFLSMLLIPARDSVFGLLIVLGMLAGYLQSLRALDFRQPLLRTFEGRCALALLALPLLIAGVRLALHVDGLAAWCAIIGLFSVALAELPRRLFGNNGWTLTAALLGLIGAAASWAVYVQSGLWQLPGYWSEWLVVVPIAAYWLESGRTLGGLGHLVRFFGSALLLLLALNLLGYEQMASALLLFMLSALFLTWSIVRRLREPALFAIAMLSLALVQMLYLALLGVNLNGWIILAAGGLTLVVGASVVEHHGQRLVRRSKLVWGTMREWG